MKPSDDQQDAVPEILVAVGPLAGQRFTVNADGGLRLGRASSCEISVPDPSLSRNHCLFELREGAVWITDLASANGTSVNGTPLGANSLKLSISDTVTAGDTILQVVAPDGVDAGAEAVAGVEDSPTIMPSAPPSPPSPPSPPPEPLPMPSPGMMTDLDLGLGKSKESEDEPVAHKELGRGLLWGAAVVIAVAAASIMLLAPPPKPGKPPVVAAIEEAKDDTLLAVSFERVDANTDGIYRYAMDYIVDGSLHVEYADVPAANRHFSRTVKLSSRARERLAEIFSGEALYKLDSEYTGAGISAGVLKSRRLKVVRGGRAFETVVENTELPEAFRDVCERLEAFSKSELGAWALNYSSEKLQNLSAEAARLGDAKWSERDVQNGNLAEAIKAYDEAVVYLDTVNPKPVGYEELLEKRRRTVDELNRRYRDQLFLVDRAENMKDLKTALRELRVLSEMVPDERDPRHAEANAKLINIENRLKKGKGK